MSKRKIILILIGILIFGSVGTYAVVKQKSRGEGEKSQTVLDLNKRDFKTVEFEPRTILAQIEVTRSQGEDINQIIKDNLGAVQIKEATTPVTSRLIDSSKLLKVTLPQQSQDSDKTITGKEQIDWAIDKVKTIPGVVRAQPNYIYKIRRATNDPITFTSDGRWTSGFFQNEYPNQWGHQMTNLDKALDITTGKGVNVAVIDTGFDPTHPDLKNQFTNPYDPIDIDPDLIPPPGKGDSPVPGEVYYFDTPDDYMNADYEINDLDGHGTMVSSVVASEKDNGFGIIGVAPESKIVPIKAGFTVKAIEWGSAFNSLDYNLIFNRDAAGKLLEPSIQNRVIKLGQSIVFRNTDNNLSKPGEAYPHYFRFVEEEKFKWIGFVRSGNEVDQPLKRGETQTFIFRRSGEYKWVDAENPGFGGTVYVEEPNPNWSVEDNGQFHTFAAECRLESFFLIQAFKYAIDQKVDIINMSYGYDALAPIEELDQNNSIEAYYLDQSLSKNIILVAAAGNEYLMEYLEAQRENINLDNFYSFPSDHKGVISVAATTKDKNHAFYSKSNHRTDIAAPGGGKSFNEISGYLYNFGGNFDYFKFLLDHMAYNVLAAKSSSILEHPDLTKPINGYFRQTMGTSFASPYVAGVIALMREIKPDISSSDALKILQDTGQPLGSVVNAPYNGHKLVDAYAAVKKLKDIVNNQGSISDSGSNNQTSSSNKPPFIKKLEVKKMGKKYCPTWEGFDPEDGSSELRYRYRLLRDYKVVKNWSKWTAKTEKCYKLKKNKLYFFDVYAKDRQNNEGPIQRVDMKNE